MCGIGAVLFRETFLIKDKVSEHPPSRQEYTENERTKEDEKGRRKRGEDKNIGDGRVKRGKRLESERTK